MTIRYCRENGYGNIDTNAAEYHLGRQLFDCQVLAKTVRQAEEEGKGFASVTMKQLEEMLIAHCRLISLVGQLRADYATLKHVLEGDAVYEYTDEKGRRYETRRQRIDDRI